MNGDREDGVPEPKPDAGKHEARQPSMAAGTSDANAAAHVVYATQLTMARKEYGDEFVAYILNCVTAELDGLAPNGPQSTALTVLSYGADVVAKSTTDYEREYRRFNLVGPTSNDVEFGIANQLRLDCGGDLPVFMSDDPVELRLMEFIRELIPGTLIRPDYKKVSARDVTMSASHIMSLPFRRLEYATLQDKDLCRLFPSQVESTSDPSTGVSPSSAISSIYWIDGHGGGYQPFHLAQSLSQFAIYMASLDGDKTISNLTKRAQQGLDLARRLARGENAEIPLLIAIANVDVVDKGFTTSKMRAVSAVEPIASILGTRADKASLILQVSAKMKLLAVSTGDEYSGFFDKNISTISEFHRAVEHVMDKTCYSLVLASDDSLTIAPIVRSWAFVNPADLFTLVSHRADAGIGQTPFPRARLEAAHTQAIGEWQERINESHPESLDIGMRRLLSVATHRLNPMDGFIDAVMCWENLFGDVNDTALKVCGSLAHLLEPSDADKRRKLFERLKKLYDTRSRLVHGSHEPTPQDAQRLRDEAFAIALKAMKAAYDVPGFMKLPKSSDRYKRMLLGA